MRKRVWSLILILAMAAGMLPSAAWAAGGGLTGTGDPGNPYRIEDAEDLAAFRDLANSGAAQAACAELTADITLNGQWKPFAPDSGYITDAYAGTFDGRGHVIRGLDINASETCQGLFGKVNGATIKNLSVEGRVVSAKAYVGGIVGQLYKGTLENCGFSGSVETGIAGSSGYVGGLVGYAGNSSTATATVSGCYSGASVSGGVAGGLAGYAKYTEVRNCYNTGTVTGKSRAGGIAGQLQNNCAAKKCYSIGAVSGTETWGDICDFLYTSATLENCYYQTRANGGGTGQLVSCKAIEGPESLLADLGAPFAADSQNVNGGYPVLDWQKGAVLPPKNPRIEIGGAGMMYMTNSGPAPTLTLTARALDMDVLPEVVWQAEQEGEVVSLTAPEDPDAKNSTVIVTGKKPGTATVSAQAGEYTAQKEIVVMPFITTAEIDGVVGGTCVIAGNTVSAKVSVLGGAELDYGQFPPLSYQWQYREGADTAGRFQNIPGATARTFTVTQDLVGKYLYYSFPYNGEIKAPSRAIQVVSAEEGVLRADREALTLEVSEIRENTTLTLPRRGGRGSDIRWASDRPEIINPDTGAVTLPELGEPVTVTLTASLSYRGQTGDRDRSFSVLVYSRQALEQENANQKYLEDALAALGNYYTMYPVFGRDANAARLLEDQLAERGFAGITAEIAQEPEMVYGNAAIARDGTITYYYQDPDSTPSIRMGSFRVTFTLSFGEARAQATFPVIVYWDAERVKAAMKAEILDKVTQDSILAPGDSAQAVTQDLTLPKTVEGKHWTLVSWQSSDPTALAISDRNQQTADTLFDPYVGVVKPGLADREVTLTAAFTFMLTNDLTGREAPIVLYKTYTVTVKATQAAAAVRQRLEERLDAGFEKAGLTDAVTGLPLEESQGLRIARNDIQLPTTRDFGVDGKVCPVSLWSSDSQTLRVPETNNAARAEVCRPPVGQEPKRVTLRVSLTDVETAVTASREFTVLVPPLTQEEVDAELALMERVKAAYFDGIKGGNTAAENISRDLEPFQEVYQDEKGELVWVRSREALTNHGIVPVPMTGWEELEAWRLFRSSNPAAVTHENLLVTMQRNAKAVRITSAFSSETLGRYGQLYAQDPETYAEYAALAPLYYQEVYADLVVRGTTTPTYAMPKAVEEKIQVSFRLQSSDSTLIDTVTYKGLDETVTVFDLFQRALKEHGFTYQSRGHYVYEITTPEGVSYREMEEGADSGWMYKVNGRLPDVNMGACGLRDGDQVVVFFSRDYLEDSGYAGNTENTGNSGSSGKKPGLPTLSGSQPAEVQSQPPFRDTADHWAETAIAFVWEKGWMTGTEPEVFAPEEPFTRAMLVTVLYRLAGQPGIQTDAGFEDVELGSWYASAVAWAKAAGIVLGVSETAFAPDAGITREETAALLRRYGAYQGRDVRPADSKLQGFTDFERISDWALEDVQWAVGAGLLQGRTPETLDPGEGLTRAEAAAVLMRYGNIGAKN